MRNHAESTVMVAPFADLQICVVLWRQTNTCRRHQIIPGIVRARQHALNHGEDFIHTVRSRHADHLRMTHHDEVRPVSFRSAAEAAADDDAAVFFQCLSNGAQRLFNRFVHEPAGINDHHIGIFIGRADAIAAGAQFGNDPFGVDQGFGASE